MANLGVKKIIDQAQEAAAAAGAAAGAAAAKAAQAPAAQPAPQPVYSPYERSDINLWQWLANTTGANAPQQQYNPQQQSDLNIWRSLVQTAPPAWTQPQYTIAPMPPTPPEKVQSDFNIWQMLANATGANQPQPQYNPQQQSDINIWRMLAQAVPDSWTQGPAQQQAQQAPQQAANGPIVSSPQQQAGNGYVPMGPYKLPDGSYTNEPPMGPYVPAGTPEAGTAEPAEPRRGRDRGEVPVGSSTADTDRGRDNGGNPVSTAEPQTEAPVPPGEDNAMFLMRPRGLSGPTGEREKAIQLTDYEGLADNARARRLSWEEYSRLTEDARRAADLNKLLVRSREDDLTRKKPMSGAREAQYNADVAEVFGPGGTKSDTVAPRVVGLLADLDINAVGKDLDDYLSLREGISADEIDKGSLQMDLANRVQFKAETAFQENPNKYWNLNSAIRDLDPKKAENAPPGFGGRKEPDEGWNDEKLYRNLWEGVQTNDPAWTVEKTKKLLNAANFNADDWTRLVEAMHLRAQNERLYAPSTSQTMSDDGKKRRSPDEILQFLAEVARAK